MEVEYATRKQQLLEECHVAPEIFHQVMPRLETFMVPFVRTFCRQEPAQHAQTYVYGLLSDLERKNVESIAYRFGQDRLPLQRFVGWAEWDDAPLRQELTRQVAQHLGQADGVLVLDPVESKNPNSTFQKHLYACLGRLSALPATMLFGTLGAPGGLAEEWTSRTQHQSPCRLALHERGLQVSPLAALHGWASGRIT